MMWVLVGGLGACPSAMEDPGPSESPQSCGSPLLSTGIAIVSPASAQGSTERHLNSNCEHSWEGLAFGRCCRLGWEGHSEENERVGSGVVVGSVADTAHVEKWSLGLD